MKLQPNKLIITIICIGLLFLNGCSLGVKELVIGPTATDTPSPIPPTVTPQPTSTFTPTFTVTPTYTTLPTIIPSITPSLTPTPNLMVSFQNEMINYLVDVNNPGLLNECGDLVPFRIGQIRTGNIETDITTALNTLFSYWPMWVQGVYLNTLNYSTLMVASVEFNVASGHAGINLTGHVVKQPDKCNKKRIKAQVDQTVRQFKEVKSFQIWVDGKNFNDQISLDGGKQ